MANDEHLALLRQGTAVWNERRPLKKPDLREADLKDADLTGADLSQSDLSDANLAGADVREADLAGADLTRANLYGAKLTRADLSIANLTAADFSSADLWNANLFGAALRGTKFVGAFLFGTNLTSAHLIKPDLTSARLSGTVFGDINLGDTVGLGNCFYNGPSVIDFRTLHQSGNLPVSFLRGCGLPDNLIDYLPSLRGDAVQFYSCFISYSAKDQLLRSTRRSALGIGCSSSCRRRRSPASGSRMKSIRRMPRSGKERRQCYSQSASMTL
jgi:Pentapeptide repeats (8 copies)